MGSVPSEPNQKRRMKPAFGFLLLASAAHHSLADSPFVQPFVVGPRKITLSPYKGGLKRWGEPGQPGQPGRLEPDSNEEQEQSTLSSYKSALKRWGELGQPGQPGRSAQGADEDQERLMFHSNKRNLERWGEPGQPGQPGNQEDQPQILMKNQNCPP